MLRHQAAGLLAAGGGGVGLQGEVWRTGLPLGQQVRGRGILTFSNSLHLANSLNFAGVSLNHFIKLFPCLNPPLRTHPPYYAAI